MNLLITGHNGFIGKHLKKLLSDYNLFFYDGDLNSVSNLHSFLKNNNIGVVIHLASKFFGSENEIFESNFKITKSICEAIENTNVRKVIFTSSGAVYGSTKDSKSKETDFCNPTTHYGYCKLLAEETIKFYSNKLDISYVILRFPSVYGKGNDKGVIHNFLTRIESGQDIILEGDGSQKRDFLHVSDACTAIFNCLSFDGSEIFNITSGKSMSISDLICLLQKNKSFNVIKKPSNNNLKNLLLDGSKSKELLKFEAIHSEIFIEE